MKLIALFLLLGMQVFGGYPPLPEPRNADEGLLIRRILESWRDKEYALTEVQIKNYLAKDPHGPYTDHFWAMLGDSALSAKSFVQAIAFYDSIEQEDFKALVQLKKWQALYQLRRYSQLYQEISRCDSKSLEEEGRLYFAEAALREALVFMRSPEQEKEGLALCEEAIPFYESLLESSRFAGHAKLGLAEIYRLLNSPQQAAALYLEVAEEENNQDVLFHAAALLLQCDKERASQIFKKLARENCPRSGDAAFQWLLLLVDTREWETLAQERDLFTSRIDAAHLPLCYFYLGLISFENGMHVQAVQDLQVSLHSNLSSQNEKKALCALLASSGELELWELSETCLDELCEKFSETTPKACCMLAAAYQKKGEAVRALKLYERVLQETPQSDFAKRASLQRMRLAIDINLKQEAYGELATEIEHGFEADLFFNDEKREKRLLLAKAYIKLGKINSALNLLNSMEEADPLLLVHCYISEGTSPDQVITLGERALTLYPDEIGLRLHLFNAYLELSKEEGEKKGYTQRAAEHLDIVAQVLPVSLENLLWLAHYYAKEDPWRAIPILASFAETEAHLKKFDTEAVLLATLYRDHQCLEEAETLLEKIAALHQKTETEAELKLAEIYAMRGELEKAKRVFQKLEEAAPLNIAYSARLQLARLEFASSPEASLKKLHDLATRKALTNEPVHLEAALDYAELKASLSPKKERSARMLALFNEVKDSFTHKDDIWSKDYHASRELLPEKDLVYQAYMRYLDARIYMLQARLTRDTKEKKTKMNAARALLSTLRHGKYAVSNYIKERSIEN